jgi:hypothetical protein
MHVQPNDLDLKSLQKGNYGYVVYYKKTRESPSTRIFLVNINVAAELYHNKPAYVIRQRWDLDTVVHSAYSVFDAKTFSTVLHDTYWKTLGYSMKYDFDAKTVDYKNVNLKNGVPDSIVTKSNADFNQSFNRYNLNWHADLIIYSLLPYKENRTFMINFYDPGFGKAEEVGYTVTGTGSLTSSDGRQIECWILNHDDTDKTSQGSYERFWISKKTKEVLKEEDFSNKRGYRFKLKLGIPAG